MLFHVAAGAVAWAVTATAPYQPSQLIGQSTLVELTATMANTELSRPEPAQEQIAFPIRIMPAEAEIARRHFHVQSTSVAEPTPFERELVAGILSPPTTVRQSRGRNEPTPAVQPVESAGRRMAVSPLQNQPGTVDRPLPELIQSPPPVYPQSAIERRWAGTVLLRVVVTPEGPCRLCRDSPQQWSRRARRRSGPGGSLMAIRTGNSRRASRTDRSPPSGTV